MVYLFTTQPPETQVDEQIENDFKGGGGLNQVENVTFQAR